MIHWLFHNINSIDELKTISYPLVGGFFVRILELVIIQSSFQKQKNLIL